MQGQGRGSRIMKSFKDGPAPTDEIDLDRNHISWVSPLARALMKSAAGDRVVLQAPGGTEYLIVLEVRYERIPVKPFREPPGAEASAKKLPADADQPDED